MTLHVFTYAWLKVGARGGKCGKCGKDVEQSSGGAYGSMAYAPVPLYRLLRMNFSRRFGDLGLLTSCWTMRLTLQRIPLHDTKHLTSMYVPLYMASTTYLNPRKSSLQP